MQELAPSPSHSKVFKGNTSPSTQKVFALATFGFQMLVGTAKHHHQVKIEFFHHTHGAYLRVDCHKLDFATKFGQKYGVSGLSCFMILACKEWIEEVAFEIR